MISAADLQVTFSTKGDKETTRAIDGVGRSVDGVKKKSLGGPLALLGFAGAIVGGFFLAEKQAQSFDAAMVNAGASLGGVGTAAGITTEQFQALSDEALRIGASTSASADEVAQAMDLMARAGIQFDAIINGGAQAVVNIGEATGESLQQSAETTAAVMNLYADAGYSADRIADIIVTGMNNSSATLSEFQTGIARLAPVIAATNMQFEDGAALIAYFNSMGLGAAEVGTSLTAVFNSVTNPTDEAAAAIANLGLQVFDAQGNFMGLPSILDQVAKATAGMTEEQRNAVLQSIFTTDAMDVVSLAIRDQMKGYEAVRTEMDRTGTAAETSAQRMNSLAGDIENFKGTLQSLAIAFGKMLLPPLRFVTQRLTAFLSALLKIPKPVLTLIAVIAGAVAAVAGLAGVIGLLTAGVGPVAVGLAAMSGAIGILLGPIGLLIGVGVVLAAVFHNQIADAFHEGVRRLSEFFSDLGKVYDRLRNGKQIFDEWTNSWYSAGTGVSAINAGIRALGSALEDLLGIEMSSFFKNIAQMADAVMAGDWSAVGEQIKQALGSIDWAGVWQVAVDGLKGAASDAIDLGKLIVKGAVELGGGLLAVAGNLYGWVKGKLFGSPMTANTGDPFLDNAISARNAALADIDLGDVIVRGAVVLGGMIADVAKDLWGWVKTHLLGGGGGITTGGGPGAGFMAGASGADWSIDIPAIAVNVLGFIWKEGIPDVLGWIKEQLGIGSSVSSVGSALSGGGGTGLTFDGYSIAVAAPDASNIFVDTALILSTVFTKITDTLKFEIPQATADQYNQQGQDAGAAVVRAFFAGFNTGATAPDISGGGGKGAEFQGGPQQSAWTAVGSGLVEGATRETLLGILGAMSAHEGFGDFVEAAGAFRALVRGEFGAPQPGSADFAGALTLIGWFTFGVELVGDAYVAIVGGALMAAERETGLLAVADTVVDVASNDFHPGGPGSASFGGAMQVIGWFTFGAEMVGDAYIAIGGGALAATGSPGQTIGDAAFMTQQVASDSYQPTMGEVDQGVGWLGWFGWAITLALATWDGIRAGIEFFWDNLNVIGSTTVDVAIDAVQSLLDLIPEGLTTFKVTWSGNPFDGFGDWFTGAWDTAVSAATPDIPDWLAKMANGDFMGAVRSILGGGAPDTSNSEAQGPFAGGNSPIPLPTRGGQPITTSDPYFGQFPDPLAAAMPNVDTQSMLKSFGEVQTASDTMQQKVTGDVSKIADAFNSATFKATFDGDIGPAAIKYTAAYALGDVWEAATFTSTFDIDHGPAAIKYTAASLWGQTWEAALFTAAFDIDNGPAAVAYTNAFSWGYAWDAAYFSASMGIDISGVYAAMDTAVAVVRDRLGTIAAMLPHSPAKEGPLAFTPSFKYIADAAKRDLAGLPAYLTGALRPGETGSAGAAAAGRSGSKVEHHYHINATFNDGEDWDAFFDEKRRQSTLSAGRD